MLAILRKELTWYASSPMMYFAGACFAGIAGYLFYGNLIMRLLLQGSALRVDLWEFTVNDIRLLIMLLMPVVSMRLLAEENRLGTIELLYTAPLSEGHIVLGKYIAGVLATGMFIGTTLLFPVLFSVFYPLQPGSLIIAYAGMLLLCAAISAAGVFFSAITKSQIVAAVAAAGFVFLLWFIDFNTAFEKDLIARLAAGLSLQKHFYNFNRGVLTLRDTVYFAGFAVFFILLTVEILRLRLRDRRFFTLPIVGTVDMGWFPCAARTGLCCLFFALCIVQPGVPGLRIDCTPGRVYTPSNITRKAFARLQSPLVLTVAYERLQKYQYEDFFELLSALSPHFSARMVQLEKNPVAAARIGLSEPGSGIVVYDGRSKRIERVNEESIVSAVFELTRDAARTIQIFSHAKDVQSANAVSFAAADGMLREQGFSLKASDAAEGVTVDPETHILVVRDLQADLPEDFLESLGAFFEKGGSVLLLVDGPEMPNLARFLKQYNVDLGNDYILDREHGGAGFDELTPVIFFNREHPAVGRCTALAVFSRVRSVQVGIRPRTGYAVSMLCFSGRGTWAEADTASALDGTARFESGPDTYGPVSAGVSVEKADGGVKKSRGRMVVLGSGSFMEDGQINLLGNEVFAKELLSWLASQAVSDRPSFEKTALPEPALIQMTETQNRIFFGVLVVLMPLIFILAGAGVFFIRRLRH